MSNIIEGEIETGSLLDQRTPNIKNSGVRTHFDKDVEGFSVEDGGKRFGYNQEDDFQDFEEEDSDLSENAYIAGHVIYKKSQRDALLRKRVNLDPKKVKPNEIAALYKIIMLGDSGCGKTSMLLRFAENYFNPLQSCTIGVDFKIKQVKIDDHVIKLQLWDTAGQERFHSISQAYLRNAHACIAVYDITRRSSFTSLESQINDYLCHADNMGLKHEVRPPQDRCKSPMRIESMRQRK